MGKANGFVRNGDGYGRGMMGPQGNPLVQCEIQEPVERMVEAWSAVDAKAHTLLVRVAADEMFDGLFDAEKEWDYWLASDKKHSCLFFDSSLEVFGDEAYGHFMKYYAAELKEIQDALAEIAKMGQGLDEYSILKTTLYNVFNNKNMLPLREYFMQVYSRAGQYGMTLEQPGRGNMDFVVHFKPLDEVNRGNSYYSYQFRLSFNPDYRRDGFVYSVQRMDAHSANAMYSGLVDFPVFGKYVKFEERVNDHFSNTETSLFHFEAVRELRVEEKKKYNIPAYYFEASFIDTSKLSNFSKKSYQYGHSSVFIPKSQVAFAGDKLYVNKWLFYKLKEEIGKTNQQNYQKDSSSLDKTLADAQIKSEQQGTGKGASAKKEADLE